jgi:hypothetical protein
MEATATRRAGLERFTFPTASTPYFVLDLANDLPSSFAGGTLDIDPIKGRIMIGGYYGSRWGYLSLLSSLDSWSFLEASGQAGTTIKLLPAMISWMAGSRS